MIKELHDDLVNGKITSTDLTKQYLDTIKADNQRLNVFLDVYKDDVLEKAKIVDEKLAKGDDIGILEGIPCAVKDNMCIAGKRTTAGSKILDNYNAPYDATVIKKLSHEGAIIVGKTNLDEFAMGSSTENSAYGVTKNPHDETRVAGGSSGGSAAAVAADMVPWSLGSDTGGSIRQPASLCGVVGLKPTYGRISRHGLLAMASSYDQIGPFTKTVEDAAIILDAISGKDPLDDTAVDKGARNFFYSLDKTLEGKKLGITKEFMGDGLADEVRKTVEEKIEWAQKQGAEIVEIELPYVKYSLGVYYLMITSEVSSNLARFDGIKYGYSVENENGKGAKDLLDVYLNSRATGFGAEVKRRIILGTYALSAGYYDAYYKKAAKVRELIKQDFKKAFEKVDVILSPTSPTVAFKIGEKTENPLEMYLADIYTVPINVAGIPAISIPIGFSEQEGKKLPIGLQIMGQWWDEQNVLDVAAGMEGI